MSPRWQVIPNFVDQGSAHDSQQQRRVSFVEILNTTTGGVRSALTLLGIMAMIVIRNAPKPEERVERYRYLTVTLFATACIIFSPAHAAALLDHPAPEFVSRVLDLSATSLSCAALISLIASRAIQRGVPMYRVRRAMIANTSIVASFVLVAWAVR
jgi:hypothetical protein